MNPAQLPLRDLHLPDPVGWWPLAPGWWFLAAALAVAAVILVHRLLRARARGWARRHALRRLNRLVADFREHRDAVRFSAEASELLRRTMLAYAPRAEIAGLTGDAWLRWLDQGLDEPQFQAGSGRLLIELPYRRPGGAQSEADIEGLAKALRRRLVTPVREPT